MLAGAAGFDKAQRDNSAAIKDRSTQTVVMRLRLRGGVKYNQTPAINSHRLIAGF